jgi:type II secretory pathway component GspD/PulD (secretin)
MRFGVNFALLSNDGQQLVTSGSGAALNTSSGFPGGDRDSLVPPLPQFLRSAAGLRYGFLSGNVTGFIEALESIGETSLVASPSVRVLNKQKAELIIGKRLGYKTQTFNNQQTIENVQFLDVGTKLILRPFATSDGLVRMEIHPEQSSGSIDINGLPTVETTEVTSNVMVRDGSTVVIGGLIDEQTEEVVDQIPLLGSIPILGNAFKTTDERLIRSELIVLITPRIVCDPVEDSRGDVLRAESEARAAYFTDRLSPVSRRNLARMHTQRAAQLYDKGRLAEALDHTRKALAIRKNDGDAVRLQGRIEDSLQARRRGMFSWPPTFGGTGDPAVPETAIPDPGHATVEPPLLAPPAPPPQSLDGPP